MANLFAFRATQPSDLKKAADPVGAKNDEWLKKLSTKSKLVIAAWGNHGSFQHRASAVLQLIPALHYMELNKTGQPKHPLYISADSTPKKFPNNFHF